MISSLLDNSGLEPKYLSEPNLVFQIVSNLSSQIDSSSMRHFAITKNIEYSPLQFQLVILLRLIRFIVIKQCLLSLNNPTPLLFLLRN